MTTNRRALVLGGGGVTGIAWEIGVLTGLAESGVDLREADLVVGTSAGAAVGVQVRSDVPLPELYAAQLDLTNSEIPARFGVPEMLRLLWSWLGSRDEQRARARIGRMALAANTVSQSRRREAIAARLPMSEWPQRPLLVTAVDAETGRFEVFDAASGAPLVDAVAASCAVPLIWPPVTIGGRHFVDGGTRSPANVDLAADCSRVVVLAPITQAPRPSATVSRQVAALAPGTKALTVTPDRASRAAMGRNALDPSRRGPAARAGLAQAAAVASAVREVWSVTDSRG